MKRIVVATGFPSNALHAVERAASIARTSDVVRIESLHVSATSRASRIATLAAATGRSDLLVIAAPAERWLLHSMFGFASRLIRRTRCPVLIVRTTPASPYRDVIVAVDLANLSDRAFARAREVAPGAHFEVIHAFQAPFEGKLSYAGVSTEAIETHRAEAMQAALFGMSELLRSQTALPRLTAHVVHGHAASALLEKQRRLRADLVVVSRAAKTLVEEWLVPGVTSRLIEEGCSDVLVVPA